ncbi:hypothetical protein N7452_001330 [Penicillium brevicompactum]|uniref:Uncharacterized protein n=1 Tax=Penicillium brevicompactum TaxID=5074 RepID=A0A9W9R2B8_PENBR|nr:hypothetical protein N7452_001330 [Penicillium brevicompactum]
MKKSNMKSLVHVEDLTIEAEPAIDKHIEFIKNQMLWEYSQQLAVDRLRRRQERIAEARAAVAEYKARRPEEGGEEQVGCT